MKLRRTDFKDLILISHDKYSDKRGYFKEIFRKNELEDILGYKINFCQENLAKSSYMVLRGLHFQKEPESQSKLISVSEGKILDIAVDIRKNSKTYGKYFSYILSSENNESLFIPAGFAHGYLTLSDYAVLSYKVDNYFNPLMESGIPYNDKFLAIDWGVNELDIIISEKDLNQDPFIW